MKKILHKLTYAQNPSQNEAYPSYYEEILCKVLTVREVPFLYTIIEVWTYGYFRPKRFHDDAYWRTFDFKL